MQFKALIHGLLWATNLPPLSHAVVRASSHRSSSHRHLRPCKALPVRAPPPSPELAVQSPPPWYAAAIGASGQHGDTLLPTAAAADMNLVSLWPVCSYACVLICHACVLILVCISYHGPIVASASLCVAHCPVDRISAVLVRSALTAALRFASWILQRKP
jgi:hypothetical protein